MTAQYQYVPAKTRHGLHFLAWCLTLGLWTPVWFAVWLRNHNRSVLKALPSAPGQAHAYAPAQYPGYAYPYSVAQPPGFPPQPLREGAHGQDVLPRQQGPVR